MHHSVLYILVTIAMILILGRPIVAVINWSMRGWIKSTRKTMHLVNRR